MSWAMLLELRYKDRGGNKYSGYLAMAMSTL